MKAKEISGFYGSGNTPCTVFVYGRWYVVEGGSVVNKTYDELNDGVNVEDLADYDCFTWSKEIESLDELIDAVDN
jgi:hypothetical protein